MHLHLLQYFLPAVNPDRRSRLPKWLAWTICVTVTDQASSIARELLSSLLRRLLKRLSQAHRGTARMPLQGMFPRSWHQLLIVLIAVAHEANSTGLVRSSLLWTRGNLLLPPAPKHSNLYLPRPQMHICTPTLWFQLHPVPTDSAVSWLPIPDGNKENLVARLLPSAWDVPKFDVSHSVAEAVKNHAFDPLN